MRKLAAVLIAAAAFAAPARGEDTPDYSHPPYQHPFEATLRAAEHGDVAAQVQVGRDYEKALGVEQNLERAFAWYKEAADGGDAKAMVALGLSGQNLNLAVVDEREFVGPWLLRAANTGIAAAQVAEARFLEASYADPENKKIALEMLERATAQGDVEAMSILGPKLLGGDDPNQWSRGEQYVSTAEKAYPRTRFYAEIRKFLRQHPGPEFKTAKIPEELRQAALRMDIEEARYDDFGPLIVMAIAGIFDLHGPFDPHDPVVLREGMQKPLEEAAHGGDLQSACNIAFLSLGTPLQFGDVLRLRETRENYKEAFDWYSSAAKRGAPRAQYHLGKLYRDGLGTDANAANAAMWFYKAAMHGYLPAEAALGDLLLHGNGLPTDYSAALGWLRPAAAYGNPMAQFDLGTMYLNGHGVGKDTGRAIALIATAAQVPQNAESGGWEPALDWIEKAQSDPAMAAQVADAVKQAHYPKYGVDTAEGGCDEASINSKIEE